MRHLTEFHTFPHEISTLIYIFIDFMKTFTPCDFFEKYGAVGLGLLSL